MEFLDVGNDLRQKLIACAVQTSAGRFSGFFAFLSLAAALAAFERIVPNPYGTTRSARKLRSGQGFSRAMTPVRTEHRVIRIFVRKLQLAGRSGARAFKTTAKMFA